MKNAIRMALPVLVALGAGMSQAHAEASTFWDDLIMKGMARMEVMHKMDGNGDHMVSKAEFMEAQGALFAAMDKNHDNMIDEGEWKSFYPEAEPN